MNIKFCLCGYVRSSVTGFRCELDEICALLDYYTVYSGITQCAVALHSVQWHYTVCSGITQCAVAIRSVQWHYVVCSGICVPTFQDKLSVPS